MAGMISVLDTALPFLALNQAISQEKYDRKRQDYADAVQQQQLMQQQQLQEQLAAQNAAQQQQQLDLAAQISNEARQKALKEKQAQVRARLGAQGILSGGGSGDVVLRNLLEETSAETAGDNAATQLRKQAIADDFASLQQRNLLARAQLQEKQRLASLF